MYSLTLNIIFSFSQFNRGKITSSCFYFIFLWLQVELKKIFIDHLWLCCFVKLSLCFSTKCLLLLVLSLSTHRSSFLPSPESNPSIFCDDLCHGCLTRVVIGVSNSLTRFAVHLHVFSAISHHNPPLSPSRETWCCRLLSLLVGMQCNLLWFLTFSTASLGFKYLKSSKWVTTLASALHLPHLCGGYLFCG